MLKHKHIQQHNWVLRFFTMVNKSGSKGKLHRNLPFGLTALPVLTLGVHPGDAVKISGNGVRQEAETQRLFELKGS